MAGSCPNKQSPEWKALVSAVGSNNAMKLFIANQDTIVTPEIGNFQLFAEANPADASKILTKYIPESDLRKVKVTTTLNDLMLIASDKMFTDPELLKWTALDESAKAEEVKEDSEEVMEEQTVPEVNLIDAIKNAADLQNTGRASEIVYKMASVMSNKTGVESVMLTADEAFDLLKDTSTLYNNQPGFFFGGKAYFVRDRATLDTVFHEFSHPIVGSIRVSNPELFNNLYNNTIATKEGLAIIDEVTASHPQLEENSDLFKEEVIVRALEKDAINNKRSEKILNAADQSTPKFKSAIAEILYAIKQWFRKTFGKVRVEKLNTNTTLDELADLITNKDFKIQLEKITDEDLAMFAAAEKNALDDLIRDIEANNSKKGLQKIINSLMLVIKKQEKSLHQFGYSTAGINEVLGTKEGGPVREMKLKLAKASDLKLTEKQRIAHDKLTIAQQATTLVSTLGTLDITANTLLAELTKILNTDISNLNDAELSKHTTKSLQQAEYYGTLFKEWRNFLEIAKDDMLAAGVPVDSALRTYIAGIKDKVDEGIKAYEKLQEKGAIEITTEWLNTYKERIDTKYQKRISELESEIAKLPDGKKRATAQDALKTAKEEYQKFSITKAKIADLFQGKLGDVSWWSSMFESYSNNPDPIIGSFATFLKDNIANIQATAVKREKSFHESIKPLLNKLNITGNDLANTWKFALTEDTTFGYKDGKLVERKVLSFLSPVHNYRYKIKSMEVAIEDKTKLWKEAVDRAKEAKDNEESEEVITKANEEVNKASDAKDQAYRDLENEKTNFFWQEYDKVVYEDNKILQSTSIGMAAWHEKNDILASISEETGKQFSELEAYENHDRLSSRWKAYQQLFSLHYSDGTLKEGDDLLKAQALNDHRRRTMKYYEYKDIKGAFDTALNSFQEQILKQYPDLSPEEYDTKVKDWFEKNTVSGFTDEYYEDLADTFRRLEEWGNKIPANLKEQLDISTQFAKIGSLIIGYKDSYGQPNATEIPTAKIDEMYRLQEELNEMQLKITEKGIVNQLSKSLQEERAEIFAKLAELRGKHATTYYMDELNSHMERMKQPEQDMYSANDLLKRKGEKDEKSILAEKLMEKDARFREWFEKNHVKKYYIEKATGKKVYKYERLAAWSVPEPSQVKYKVKMKYTQTDPVTGVSEEKEVIGRTPSLKYKVRVVKAKYKTERIVGETVDNKGNFLPKGRDAYKKEPAKDAQGNIITNPYINNAYYTLAESKKDHAELLRLMKEYHIQNQDKIDYDSRLYMDVPRFRIGNQRLDTQEQIESGMFWNEKKKSWDKIVSGAKATWKGKTREEANEISYESGDYEMDMGMPDTEELDPVEFMQQISAGSVVDRLPIQGTSYMTPEDTSKNLLKALNVYMMSAEKQRVFTEINPIAKAVVNTLSKPENDIKFDGMDQAQINSYLARQIKLKSRGKGSGEKSENIRAATALSLYNREFKGKIFSEKHLDWVNKITSKLMKGASFNYFALNLPSAIKNYWGAVWQMNMEAIAGEHMSLSSYGKGKAWSISAMKDWMNHIYGGDNYSLNNQLMMFFDPLQGKLEESFGEHAARTKKGDIMSLSWLYSPRKFGELEAAFQLFGGMMHHKQVPITKKDGTVGEIPYMEAFELKGTNLVLKEGVDKDYDIGGKKYLEFRNLMHEKSKDLNGAFAKMEQPQAQAHFAYRLIMFMRRYFTTMFMNRFSNKRASIVINDTKQGFYREAIITIGRIIKSNGYYINYMEPSEKIAAKKIATEVSQIIIVSAIVALLFGYDDDDPERFAKMEERSGAIGSEDFNLPGFLANHLLVLLLKTSNENETFIPLPGFGLNDYTKMASVTSIAFGPTITKYGQIITDIAMHAAPGEDDSLFYKRDQGPYPWQKEESAKIWSHLGGMWGVTGSDVDIIKGARSFDSVSNKWS